MRVLAAVLADARQVALDVAGIEGSVVEGRSRAGRISLSSGRTSRSWTDFHGLSASARARRRPRSRPTTGRSSRSGTRRSVPSRAGCRRRRRREDTSRRPRRVPRPRRRARRPARGRGLTVATSPRASASAANLRRESTRNQASQTLSPLPPAPTRFIPSFQSPLPISGRP